MEEREDKPCLYITYKDGYAEVEIEEDGVRRKHDAKYKNTDGKDEYDFCAEVADKVEAEMGVPVLWSFVNGKKKQQKSKKNGLNTALKVGGVVVISTLAVLGVLFVGLVAYSMANLPNNKSSASSTSSSQTTTPQDTKTTSSGDADRSLSAVEKQQLAELKLVQPTEVYLESNSSYTVCTGTVTNKSDKYHRFIQVKGEFMDEADNTIDTAWTYACGDEGLAPGESSKFTMSVARDSRITNVRCYTYDFV